MRRLFDQVAPKWDQIRSDPMYLGNYVVGMKEVDNVVPAENRVEPSTVLDVACGTGMAAVALHERFPNAQITGVDISSEMIALAKEKVPSGTFVVASASEPLPFKDESFDRITSLDGVFDIPQLVRLLAPGGVIHIAYTAATVPVYRDIEGLANELRAARLEAKTGHNSPGMHVWAWHPVT
jgi:ubiquinone/menaquinone biosynthesis C-methylase UbiE